MQYLLFSFSPLLALHFWTIVLFVLLYSLSCLVFCFFPIHIILCSTFDTPRPYPFLYTPCFISIASIITIRNTHCGGTLAYEIIPNLYPPLQLSLSLCCRVFGS